MPQDPPPISPSNIEALQRELEPLDARSVLRFALEQYGQRLVLTSSFGPEDVLLIDLLIGLDPSARVVTLDTGRLHQETHDTIARIRDRYEIKVETFTPNPADLESLLLRDGPNGFYHSTEARHACCDARKVKPLQRILKTADAWITGMRREQTVTRANIPKVELDPLSGVVKFNPLADWTHEQVWASIRERNIPYNPLNDRGFLSVGCAPCTRAVRPGEDPRAGRWWWERSEHSECGLHVDYSTH